MRENLSRFRGFSEANKDEKKISFIISAVSDPSYPGSSIYLYEKGNLTDTQFQPVSKPDPPVVKNILEQTVSLKLQKSPSGITVAYRVEYKEVKADSGAKESEQWCVINTPDEDFTLTGLEPGKQYLIRYRIVGKVGVSEASDTVNVVLSSAQVGGSGGFEFSFKFLSCSISKISITYSKMALNTIKAIFSIDHWSQEVNVGNSAGPEEKTFELDEKDKIVAARLWPNTDHNRCGGLEFVVVKNSGERMTLSVKCDHLGEPVSVDVKSGKCCGIRGRSGADIDALGFYFI